MYALLVLSLAISTLALPGLEWLTKRTASYDDIPPEWVRDKWPQFNVSQWEKYHCFTFADLIATVPPCADYCETYTLGELTPGGFARDGCHQDDFPCHCARSEVIAKLIEPCIFPFLNKTSACKLPDLAPVQAFVTDSCTFYNATQYADYHGCSKTINKGILADIAAGTAPVPTIIAQAFDAEDWS